MKSNIIYRAHFAIRFLSSSRQFCYNKEFVQIKSSAPNLLTVCFEKEDESISFSQISHEIWTTSFELFCFNPKDICDSCGDLWLAFDEFWGHNYSRIIIENFQNTK